MRCGNEKLSRCAIELSELMRESTPTLAGVCFCGFSFVFFFFVLLGLKCNKLLFFIDYLARDRESQSGRTKQRDIERVRVLWSVRNRESLTERKSEIERYTESVRNRE